LLKSKSDILEDAHMREKGVVLEDQPDASTFGWHAFYPRVGDLQAVDPDRSLTGCDKARNGSKKRGLARPRSAEKGHEFPSTHGKPDVLENEVIIV
jgi:hypothetical protein